MGGGKLASCLNDQFLCTVAVLLSASVSPPDDDSQNTASRNDPRLNTFGKLYTARKLFAGTY